MAARQARSRAPSGFTLMELMVTLVIAGVLAAIAIPAYQGHVQRGRRADAMAALAAVQQAQERFRANRAAYTSTLSDLTGVSSVSPDRHYSIAITAAGAASYTITASAISTSPQYQDTACRVLTLQMTGGNIAYRSTDSGGNTDSGVPNRCWVR